MDPGDMEVCTSTPLILQPALSPNPLLISGTHSSGSSQLSTAPIENWFGAHQPSWEALGFQQGWAHPRSMWEGHGAVLLCLSWRGHQTCTPQGVNTTQWEAESSSKSSLTALLGCGALQWGDYSAWDLDLISSNPQSKSPLAKGCFGKVAF